MSDSWKITLPCTRDEAEALTGDSLFVASTDSVPTIVTREIDESRPNEWAIDIYCNTQPDADFLANISDLSPSSVASQAEPLVEKLVEEDWVTLSQSGLEPLRAGRFYVHTVNDSPTSDPDSINIRIDASQAFGTGHHETTMGCLRALDRLKRRGQNYRNIIDVGTGTGLLAIAAKNLWPVARHIASDLDPIAVDVSIDNAALNGLRSGPGRSAIQIVASNGLDHHMIKRRAPYDLIIANILARPLIGLAAQIAAAAAPGTILILAGLLRKQQDELVAVFVRNGFRLRDSHVENEWPCLVMVMRDRHRRGTHKRAIKSPLARDSFGEW